MRRQDGFTLLELIIYVAIFATMIGAVVGLALASTAEKTRGQITADINYQGEAVMALMTQTIRQATAVNTPSAGNSSGNLSLSMTNSLVNPTTFALVHDVSDRLQIGEGTPAITNNLTNTRAKLSGLTFTNMSLESTKGSILIKFTLSYNSTSVRQELTYSKTFYGAATIP